MIKKEIKKDTKKIKAKQRQVFPPGGNEFWSKGARDLAQVAITFGNYNKKELVDYLVKNVTAKNKKVQERHVANALQVIKDKHNKHKRNKKQ